MKGILGKKLGMAQIFDSDGKAIPVTVVSAGPCLVTDIRTREKDGYNAIQMGFGYINEKKISRLGDRSSKKKRRKNKIITMAFHGLFKKHNLKPLRFLREFRTDNTGDYQIGQEVKVTIFENGQMVDVTGKSKGKGFAGGMKRHRFSGGGASHGSMIHRQPASSGSTDAARTYKGTRKPGRMGFARVTALGLKIVRVDSEKNLLLIRGAVPGQPNGLVLVRESVKGKKSKN